MNDEDLSSGGNAADRHMRDPGGIHPAFVLASPWRRIAAGTVDVVLALLIAGVVSITGFITTMIVLRTDFDGPPQYDVLADWYMLTYFALGLVVFCVPEAFGVRTPGKAIFGLLVVSYSDDPQCGPRYVRRWLVKLSPALLLAVVAVAGTAHTEIVGWEGFDDFGWTPGWDVVLACALPAAVVAAAFLMSFQREDGRAAYDVTSATVVVRPASATQTPGRAFAVVLKPDDVAAVREGLEQLDRGEGIPWAQARSDLNARHGL